MANEHNLIPFSERTARERSEFGRRGAEASNKVKKEKKTLANTINRLMELPLQSKEMKEKLKLLGLEDNEMNNQTAMVVAMYYEALKGNVTAFNSLRDSSGNNYQDIKEEQEKEEIEHPLIFMPAKDIGKAFVDINRWIDERKYNDLWFEGGRGSIKSSYISEKAIEILENNPRMCALVLRQVGNTLKDSVYSQIQWGIEQISESYSYVKNHWKSTKSPLEIKNIDTGQLIYFRGADDPGKIKSIKPPKGMYIGLVIFEEFDQFKGMAEVRKIEQSAKRGGDDILTFKIYNTPKSTNHYVNKEKIIPKKGRYLHKSTYLDVPKEWLGQPFIDDADYLKEAAPKIYENEYLGKMTGDGGNVFENIILKEITDEMIKNFDYTYQGIDFGWFPDPLAWTKMCYQPDKKILYIFDEYVVNKMSNEKVWNYLQENKGVTKDDLITADSAEPKSIGDFQGYGSLMRGAKKGPDSVDYSMKWLSSLAKIVIDPKRCPKSAEEFTTYEYDTDKDGNYISKFIDANNHCIDSVRYAMNPIWRRKGE
jgi:PBSX family phage terminase large subunit